MLLIQCNFYIHHFWVRQQHTAELFRSLWNSHKKNEEFSGIRTQIQDTEMEPDMFSWKRWQESQFRIPADQQLSSLFVKFPRDTEGVTH